MIEKLPTWRELFPDGRQIFLEDGDSVQVAAEIKEEFGFDPNTDEGWGVAIPGDRLGPAFVSYSFHCPPEYLDAIYGGERWFFGS